MDRRPEIDLHRCSGCGWCVEICPQNALALNEEKLPGWQHILGLTPGLKAFLKDRDICIGCGHCASVCKRRAIYIEPFI